jgi:hypothetical protein
MSQNIQKYVLLSAETKEALPSIAKLQTVPDDFVSPRVLSGNVIQQAQVAVAGRHSSLIPGTGC